MRWFLFDIFVKVWYTNIRGHTNNGRRSSLFLIFAPTAHWNRWEVIGMMDQYVTFGDLLKIGSFLLDLISVILYIYYNHKNSNQNHHGKKKK